MEVFALDNFNKLKPSTIPMEKSQYHLSDERDQDDITTTTHICILLQLIISKGFIASFSTTMWYHTDGCTNQYRCTSDICLILYIVL